MLYEKITIPEARDIQERLRTQVDIAERPMPDIRTIAAADISLNLYSTTVYAGIVLLSFPALQPFAYSLVKAEIHFPYVPGFLAFREVPPLVEAWNAIPLEQKADVLIVDGHGIAHPRRMGIATHLGVLLNQPTIGCAKKMLYGSYAEPEPTLHSYSPIIAGGEQLGFAFRSKARTAPVFISPGHHMSMQNCLELMKRCTGKYRIPEPTRWAHEAVNRFRTGMLPEGYTEA